MNKFEIVCPNCGATRVWNETIPHRYECFNCKNKHIPANHINEIEIESDGVLSFKVQYGDSGYSESLNLDHKGNTLYEIGYGCDTCNAHFKHIKPARLPIAPDRLGQLLEEGLHSLSKEIVETITFLLPKGTYIVGLLRLIPNLMEQGERPWYMEFETDNYWTGHERVYKNQSRFEAIFPLIDTKRLNRRRIRHYEERFKSGDQPTALVLSRLEVRNIRGEYTQWVLSHFLLDGHHKMLAASNSSDSLTVLSFLRLWSTGHLGPYEEEIREYYAGGILKLDPI